MSSPEQEAAEILTKFSSDSAGQYEKAVGHVSQKFLEIVGSESNVMLDKSVKARLKKSQHSLDQTHQFQLPQGEASTQNIHHTSAVNSQTSERYISHFPDLPLSESSRMTRDTVVNRRSLVFTAQQRKKMAPSPHQVCLTHSRSFNLDGDQDDIDMTDSQGGDTELDDDEQPKSGRQTMYRQAMVEDDEEEEEEDFDNNDDRDVARPLRTRLSGNTSKRKGKAIIKPEPQQQYNLTSSPKQNQILRRQRHAGDLSSALKSKNSGSGLLPSRYSGAKMPWHLNNDPTLINQEDVSDASLLKRGLSRGNTSKVCKRGYGANDPENIRIVNLRENRSMSFPDIVEKLNQERIDTGRTPSLTVCGVTSRYNRTAPLLFASQGKEFVPLSKRRAARNGAARVHGSPTGFVGWTDELDTELVKAVQFVDSRRWQQVADQFHEQTGMQFSASDVSRRHAIL